MDNVQRIVIPTDGSDHSHLAVEEGLALARTLKKPVLALYVIDDQPFQSFRGQSLLGDLRTILQREATATLADLKARGTKLGVKVATEVRTGDPAEEIVSAARPTDLIVMATHGRRGLPRLLLGSLAESVVRHAPGPVLVLRRPKKARA